LERKNFRLMWQKKIGRWCGKTTEMIKWRRTTRTYRRKGRARRTPKLKRR